MEKMMYGKYHEHTSLKVASTPAAYNGRIAVVSAVLPEESVSVEEKRKKENNE